MGKLRILSCGFASLLLAQSQGTTDFANDVLPLLRQNCIGCHGPSMQQGGLRLDRKSSVLKGFSRRVVAGNSTNSMVYHRLIGSEYGPQMPPTGPLKAEQVATIKAWIDQGANWPDSLANETELPPLNPKAVSLVESLRNDDLPAFMKTVGADPAILNARGPEGSTPFMYAVLYANTATVEKLLKLGADPNIRNDTNATALMWAAKELDKTRLLLARGADVNAKSDDLRTPLMIAARRPGGAPTVKILLDKGANPNPNTKAENESSPLLEALTAADAAIVELLIQRGADAKAVGQTGLTLAVQAGCAKCVDLLAAKITDKAVYTGSLQDTAVYGDIRSVRLMLEHGADVKAFDGGGRTALMYAAISDVLPLDVVKLLVDRGADVNAHDKHRMSGDAGLTVLDIAMLNGKTPIVDFLVKSGAKAGSHVPVALKPRHDNPIKTAVQDSLPLLQRSDAAFSKGSGCISCHNNSITAMTVGLARQHGFRIDEQSAAAQVKANVLTLEKLRDRMHQGFMLPTSDNFSESIVGYILMGLAAENYKADLNTDAAALEVLSRQRPNGEWFAPKADTRPPICLGHIGSTVQSMRALQLYAPKANKAAVDKSIQLATAWLAKAESFNNDDRGWRVAGLAWARADKAVLQKAMQELLATQRPDGGWSDMPSLESSSYATGKSMVALQIGGLPTSDPAYQRGVRYLLSTQQQDGSWYLRTRALAFQPWFDAGFPGGHDQWISSAGTGWAALALTLALPDTGTIAAR